MDAEKLAQEIWSIYRRDYSAWEYTPEDGFNGEEKSQIRELAQALLDKYDITEKTRPLGLDEYSAAVFNSETLRNHPHEFQDTGVLLNIDCAICDRAKEDTIHNV